MRRRIGLWIVVALAACGWMVAATAGAADFSGWNRTMTIAFTGYNPPGAGETLTDFPALVTLHEGIPGFRYTHFLSGDHDDLRFADALDQELPYEIEKWDTNGVSCVWVRVPQLAGTGSVIRAYWGKTGETAPDYTTNGATWDNGFAGVWHLGEAAAPGDRFGDSTTNANHGTFVDANTNSLTGVNAVAGAGIHLSGSLDYISVPNSPSVNPTEAITMEAWARSDNATWNASWTFLSKLNAYLLGGYVGYRNIRAYFYDAGTWRYAESIPATITGWRHYVGTYDRAVLRLYVDGVQVASIAYTTPIGTTTNDLRIGRDRENASYLDGMLDEVRLSAVARSTNWIWACHRNQSDPEAFAVKETGVPAISNQPASLVSNTSAVLNGYLVSTGRADTIVTVYWGPTDGGLSETNWAYTNQLAGFQAEGALSFTATNLTANTNWFFTFFASNAAGVIGAAPSETLETWGAPSVDNEPGATVVGSEAATLNGTLLDGFGATVSFFWGTAAETLTNETASGTLSEGAFSVRVSDLEANTTYFYRAFASNDYGTAWASVATSFTTLAAAPYRYVATNAPAGGDGSSWATAFQNVQEALDRAEDGDEIRLAGHTFWVGQELLWADRTGVTIRGGWEGVGSPGSHDPALWPTVIRRLPSATNRLLRVEAVTGGVEQVTFLNGLVTDASRRGGAMVVSNSVLILAGCGFVSNAIPYTSNEYVSRYGGAFFAANSDLVITNCAFQGNQIASYRRNYNYGGAVYATGGSLEIVDTVFRGNSVTGSGGPGNELDRCYGGAVYAAGATAIRKCAFSKNRVTITKGGPCAGAGLYAVGDLTVSDSAFSGNRAQSPDTTALGGALYVRTNAVVRNVLINLNAAGGNPGLGAGLYVDNGILAVNAASFVHNRGEALYVRASLGLSVSNSIFNGNDVALAGFPTNETGELPDVGYCAIDEGVNDGFQGCFAADPLFEHGFRLATNSPCVDAGGQTAAAAGLDGATTRTDGVPDAGTLDLGYHVEGALDPVNLYVLGTGSDSESGASWEEALRSITKALALAQDGTHIHVGEGLYTNQVETFPLTVERDGIRILGTNAALCVVNALGSGQRVVLFDAADLARLGGVTIRGGRNNSGPVYQGAGVVASYSDLAINGCRIENNGILVSGSEGHQYKGGGVYALWSGLSISNCVIASNTLGNSSSRSILYYGAGCMIEGGAPVEIVDTVLLANAGKGRGYSGNGSTLYGGGLYASVPVTLRNCTVISNTLSASLGSMQGVGVLAGSTLTAEDCFFLGNRGIGEQSAQSSTPNVSIYGGGVRVNGTASFERSVVSGNTLTVPRAGAAYGGGLSGGAISLRNVLVAGNSGSASNVYGGGIHAGGILVVTNVTVTSNAVSGVCITGAGSVQARDSIFWGNGIDLDNFPTNEAGVIENLWYCAVEDGNNAGTNGCVSVDPLFVDGAFFHLSSRQGHLTAGWFSGTNWTAGAVHSPLIDAGDPSSAFALEPEPNGRQVNMGAYGNTAWASKSLVKGTLLLIR